MLILLPPSEGKSPPGRGRPMDPGSMSFPVLHGARGEVLDALVALCTTDDHPDLPHHAETARHVAAQTLGLGPTQAHEVERNARLRRAPAARADRVYSGVLYEALDLPSLDGVARRRATQWLAITSGLFGLVRPSDRIPAYRLAGGVTLPGVGPVSTFWSRHLEEAVREAAGRGLVVDLRSSTYLPFWRPGPEVSQRVVTLRVLHEVDGARKVVSHFNKATKGRIVRSLLQDGGTTSTPDAFAVQLRDLGWQVETRPAGRNGAQLDVVVADL